MEFSIREGFEPEVYIESANVFGSLLDEFYPEAFEDSYNFASMFESEGSTPDKPAAAVKTGFIASVKNAYNAMVDKLKEIIKKCRDFITLKFASAETKAKVKELQDAIDADPNLKGIKVTVPDYEKIHAIYEAANKKAEEAYKEAEKKDAEPNELQKQLNAIEETTKKAIPTAVKAIGITIAAAAAAGFLKNINGVMDSANKKAAEIAKNVEETVANFGHEDSANSKGGKSKKGKNTRSGRRRMAFDGQISKFAGQEVKDSTYSLKNFWINVFKAIRGDRLAAAKLGDQMLNGEGASKGARKVAGIALRIAGAKAEREHQEDLAIERREKREEKKEQARQKAEEKRQRAEERERARREQEENGTRKGNFFSRFRK